MLVVANRIPVVDGREHEFEELFVSRTRTVERPPGLQRVELLRPLEADEYVIQAYWDSREAFEDWRSSNAFQLAHKDLPADMFAGSNELDLYELTELNGS